MQVDILIEADGWDDIPLQDWADRAVHATCDHLNIRGYGSVAILACDDARIADLNAEFRGKPVPTNVLSWPSNIFAPFSAGSPPPAVLDLDLGDIAIAFDTCMAEARDQQKQFSDHVTHLLIHATLHLLGYDHIRAADATRMEGLEVEILANLSISNPYVLSH